MVCKSCSSPIFENSSFCSICGSKIVNERLTLKGTWHEFAGPFFSWDNNFWRTFTGLITKPKDVLESYINGARKKYFHPFSYLILFATIAVIFYKIFPMAGVTDFSEGFNNGFNTKAPSQSVPAVDMKSFMENMMNYYNFYYILTIPIISVVSYFTFFKRGNNFAEHLVFNSYIQTNLGFISLVLQVLFLNIIGLTFLEYYIFYLILAIIIGAYSFKKLYSLNLKQTTISIIKFWAILIVIYIVLIVTGVIIKIISMLIAK